MEWNAEDYHKSSSQQQKWALELLAGFELKGNERVLDVGCGDGKITAHIAQRVPRGSALGVDNSASMIEFAEKNFPKDVFPNLSFQAGDARSLHFQTVFDVIVSFAALHWISAPEDHQRMLSGMADSLRPTGKILLQFGGKGNAAGVERAAKKVRTQKKWSGFFKDFTPPWGFYGAAAYRKQLERAGFSVLRVELVPKDMIHKGKEGVMAWMRATHSLPYMERLPGGMREVFLQEMADIYVQMFPEDAHGNVHVEMTRLEVEAEK